jgi:hypothetical protein
MVAVYCLFLSMVIGGGLDHCMMPPFIVDDGVVVPLGAWLELQAGNMSAAVIRHTIMNK